MSMSLEVQKAERAAAFEYFWGAFERAEISAGPCNWYGDLGGGVVHLRSAGPALLNQLVPALAHRARPQLPADLTVGLWDSRASGYDIPRMLTMFIQMVKESTWESLESRHEVRELNDDRFRGCYRLGPDVNILSFLDQQTNRAIYWMEDGALLPYWETSSPLQMILNWWAESRDLQYVHAAAVGSERGALLLTGPGGSGKSSTALACLNSELGYLADDYCLVEVEPATVHSLYCTAKLVGEPDFARFPHLRGWVDNPARTGDDKAVLNLHKHRPDKLFEKAPLRAVIVPQVSPGAQQSKLTPLKGSQALMALAPSTLFQLAGTHQGCLSRMARLLRKVPCYRLELGSDVAALPKLLSELLETL